MENTSSQLMSYKTKLVLTFYGSEFHIHGNMNSLCILYRHSTIQRDGQWTGLLDGVDRESNGGGNVRQSFNGWPGGFHRRSLTDSFLYYIIHYGQVLIEN